MLQDHSELIYTFPPSLDSLVDHQFIPYDQQVDQEF